MIDLEEVALALDAFPDWDENMRAEVYHAIDVAPDLPLSTYVDAGQYFQSSEAHAAWERIKLYPLEQNTGTRWVRTLEEAAGYESAPTKSELLEALHRGARMIR